MEFREILIQTTRILKAFVFVALTGLCISLGILTYKLSQTLEKANALIVQTTQTSKEAGKLMASSKDIVIAEQHYLQKDLPDTMKKINDSLDKLNDVLFSTQETVSGLNTTILQVQQDEHALLTQTGIDTHNIALAATTTVNTTNDTVRDIQPLIASTQTSIDSLNKTTQDLDGLILDPNIKSTLANVTSTTNSVSGMASDTASYWHGLLHPSWPKRIWNAVTGVGLDAAKVFVP